jgi:16S rRNA (guanine527-N7)-methyltransferase
MKNLKEGAARLSIDLQPEQLEKFDVYATELAEWNRRLNLTSISGDADIRLLHFLDSLTIKLALPETDMLPLNIIDIGSGAGFPGIPLAIAFPKQRVYLLEATRKKTDFLRHIQGILGLENITIINERAETAAHDSNHREQYDVAVARALASLPALAELMLPFCKIGGRMVAQKKGDIDSELTASAHAVAMLGGESPRIVPIELAEFADNRRLIVVTKSQATPDAYPRRPGIPAKKPL